MLTKPLILEVDDLIGAHYEADQLAKALHARLVIDDIKSKHPDVLYYRSHYEREMRRRLEALALDCGFALVPISPEEQAAVRERQDAELFGEEEAA